MYSQGIRKVYNKRSRMTSTGLGTGVLIVSSVQGRVSVSVSVQGRRVAVGGSVRAWKRERTNGK